MNVINLPSGSRCKFNEVKECFSCSPSIWGVWPLHSPIWSKLPQEMKTLLGEVGGSLVVATPTQGFICWKWDGAMVCQSWLVLGGSPHPLYPRLRWHQGQICGQRPTILVWASDIHLPTELQPDIQRAYTIQQRRFCLSFSAWSPACLLDPDLAFIQSGRLSS